MKIPFGSKIKDLKGDEIKSGDVVLTLGVVCTTALLSAHEADQAVGGNEKVRRFKLAMAADQQQEVDMKAEDVALIKSLVARHYAPLVVGRAFDLLDPSDFKEE